MSLGSKIDRRILNALQTNTNRQTESIVTQITKTQPTTGVITSISGVTAKVRMNDQTEKTGCLGTKVYNIGATCVMVGSRIL